MQLEDLLEEPGANIVVPVWKVRMLVMLSSAETIGWAAALAYEVLAGDVKQSNIGQAAAELLAWVRLQTLGGRVLGLIIAIL